MISDQNWFKSVRHICQCRFGSYSRRKRTNERTNVEEENVGERKKRERDTSASQAIDSVARRKKIIWTNKTDGQTDDRFSTFVRLLGRKTRRREEKKKNVYIQHPRTHTDDDGWMNVPFMPDDFEPISKQSYGYSMKYLWWWSSISVILILQEDMSTLSFFCPSVHSLNSMINQ